MKHIQRQQFSFTKTSIKVFLKILVYVLSRLPGLEVRKSLKAFFYSHNYNQFSLERFLSTCGEKMSKGFLKFYKLIMKPDTRSDHVSNLTNVHKLNSRIKYARLHYIRYRKRTSNTIITQAYHSRYTENYQMRPESLHTFQPSYASSKVKNENDRISDFDKRRISQPKTQ